MVLICISLMISEQHWTTFLVPLGHLYVFFEENCLFRYSANFLTQYIYIYISAWVLWILDINYLSDTSFISIFTNSVGSLFILLIASFNVQMHFSWWPLFFHFCFCFSCLRRHIQKKILLRPVSASILPIFSWKLLWF